MTALFPCRAHWSTSQSVKGIHPRARTLKRKNRRHHGLSADRTGPGRLETTNSRKPLTMAWQGDAYFAVTATAGISLAKSAT